MQGTSEKLQPHWKILVMGEAKTDAETQIYVIGGPKESTNCPYTARENLVKKAYHNKPTPNAKYSDSELIITDEKTRLSTLHFNKACAPNQNLLATNTNIVIIHSLLPSELRQLKLAMASRAPEQTLRDHSNLSCDLSSPETLMGEVGDAVSSAASNPTVTNFKKPVQQKPNAQPEAPRHSKSLWNAFVSLWGSGSANSDKTPNAQNTTATGPKNN